MSSSVISASKYRSSLPLAQRAPMKDAVEKEFEGYGRRGEEDARLKMAFER